MAKLIKTKIVSTVGPASMDIDMLVRLIRSGVDVFRVNFSHGSDEQHQQMLTNIRMAGEWLKQPVAVMADLCGPKIRVGVIADGEMQLRKGDLLTIQRDPIEGADLHVSTTLPELVDDIRVGHRVLMDDGKLELKVVKRDPGKSFTCEVITGGPLKSGKGVNLPKTALKLSALTEKDHRDAKWIAQRDFDYVALSFVQRASDVRELRKLLNEGKSSAGIIAKIEKPQALKNITGILNAADGLLVARGDLGVETPAPSVPIVQKQLVDLCRRNGKCCIVATQMLETMIECPSPTRAEVSDVANAVFDGSDAVMLSGETAVGKYPVRAVRMMNDIARSVETHITSRRRQGRAGDMLAVEFDGATASIARAVRTLVQNEDISVVVAYTFSGDTALKLAKMRLSAPVLALTPSQKTINKSCLFYGVKAEFIEMLTDIDEVVTRAAAAARKLRWARKGQKIAVVFGRPVGKAVGANAMVVHELK